MRYFDYLTEGERESIFFCPPESFDRDGDKELLAYALGSTLYMPANKENISEDIIKRKNPEMMSMTMCLEDAIGDHVVNRAEESVLYHLKRLSAAVVQGEIDYQDIPLMFLRVRSPMQLMEINRKVGEHLKILTGFVFPKFSLENGSTYFNVLTEINRQVGKRLYGMPILETPDIIYKETRLKTLNGIRKILNDYNDLVLNVRIGATDFCSQFGIRRSYDITIYDIAVVRDCISDILNVFSRIDGGYVVSGPVWEYFCNGDRVLKPQLRQSPFEETYGSAGLRIREKLLSKYLDGLIREVLLDKANGLIGKTIIHPTHIIPVQALHVVSHEEYVDACSIIYNNNGKIGVIKSQYQNKMNEIKPHLNWAKKIILKSRIYGVFHEKQNYTSLLTKATDI